MKRNKTITEKDIFFFYPYKKNPPMRGNTIPQPYVKQKDISDHRLSLTYDIWLSVIQDYVEEIQGYILRGKIVKLPNYLGNLQLKKYKLNRKIDWGETKKQGKKVYMPVAGLYEAIVKWDRNHKICKFKNSDYWKIRMSPGLGNRIYQATLKDPGYIYSIINI